MNKITPTSKNSAETRIYIPNPVMISRQIDSLREVMRRMRTSQTSTVETLINQKLQNLLEG